MSSEMNFMIGGEAGQGVQSVGFLLAKALARGGYHVFADQDYESRIRGGHNFFRVRARRTPVAALSERLDILVALNKETIDLHRQEVVDGGVAIYDSEQVQGIEPDGKLFLDVPMRRLAREQAGGELMSNTVGLGAALALVKYDFATLKAVLDEFFGGKVGEDNVKAARAGYDYARDNLKRELSYELPHISDARRMLINANDAIALGAIAAGCKFVSAYPMTPSTPIMEYMASKAEQFGIVVVQPEDEIAAMTMAVGAAFAGVRAMTATSGSGFCLMVEGYGLAAMTETPVVIVDGQRPGPTVGLPTRTEQGDLQFVLHAHHGDFPRSVLAPIDAADFFWQTVRAFNIADRYQLPVIILNDHFLATAYSTVEAFDISKVTIDRGELFDRRHAGGGPYKRHRFTASGISPRAFPGEPGIEVITDSDEHDEIGHLIEDAATRARMVEKRLHKLEGLKQELLPPTRYGPADAGTLLIGWGSSFGALTEAVDILRAKGADVNLVQLNELAPFAAPPVSAAIGKARRTYVVESNATGQLAELIRTETGKQVTGKVLRYDGRPLSPAYIVDALAREGI